MKAIVCGLDAMWCALPVEHIDEVMRPRPLAPIVDGPAIVAGLGLIRGRFIPVVDLGLLLLGRSIAASRWLSLRVRERQAAIAVGEVLGISEIDPSTLTPWPDLMAGTRSAAIDALAARDQQLFAILSMTRVVAELPARFVRVETP